MTVAKICTKNVATATRDTPVTEAAKQMRHRHVGNLVVVENRDGKVVPVGVVTDRDIVISVLAPELDPKVFTLGDMLLKDAITCREDLDVASCLHQMRTHAIRRMVVVDASGALAGIIALDDIIRFLAGEMGEVSKLIEREQVVEMKTRV
jgi:predicted transcriptional regulator